MLCMGKSPEGSCIPLLPKDVEYVIGYKINIFIYLYNNTHAAIIVQTNKIGEKSKWHKCDI